MSPFLKVLLIIAMVMAAILIIGYIGLHIQPKSFADYPRTNAVVNTIPLPAGLPAPVERFYRTVYGDQIPVVESAVITGHASVRPFGPFYFPARFRFSHIAGQSYRHYIEATFFGFPLFKVNERYLKGVSKFEPPVGEALENQPKTNQGANLGMWSESIWFPSIFLTDPRVQWEAQDDVTALLRVPFEDGQETYVVRFNPETGLIDYMESMRYHAENSPAKTLWINESREWVDTADGKLLKTGAAIWMDQGTPWAIFTVDDIVFNEDLSEYISARGE